MATEELKVALGNSVTLPCSVAPTNQDEITRFSLDWLKDNAIIYTIVKSSEGEPLEGDPTNHYKERLDHESDGSLKFLSTTSKDAGEYRCRYNALNRPSEWPQSNPVFLRIETLPFFRDVSPESVLKNPGDTVSLRCKPRGVPQPAITWTRDGETVEAEDYEGRLSIRRDGKELEIRKLKEGDQGNYACVAENSQGRASHTTALKFTKAAWFDAPPENKTAILDTNLIWVCHAQGDPNTIHYTWHFGDSEIRFTSNLALRAKVEGGNLMITAVEKEDTGWFRCTASNEKGPPAVATAYLDVHYPAVVSRETPRVQTVPAGLTSDIFCIIDANPPFNNVIWYRDGQILDTDSPQTRYFTTENGSRLHFTNSSKADEGTYSCNPTNEIGSPGAAFQVHVMVKSPPYYTRKPKSEIVKGRGETAKLSCSGDGDPKPKIFWRKKGEEGVTGKRSREEVVERTAELELRDLRAEDYGVYECVLENTVTTLTEETLLVVNNTVPQAPVDLIASASDSSLSLSWTPGFDGGHSPQSYTVRYRRAGRKEMWEKRKVEASTSLELPDLLPSTFYVIHITPGNSLGDGIPTQPITISTQGYGSDGIMGLDPYGSGTDPHYSQSGNEDKERPSKPENFRVDLLKGELKFRWDSPASTPVKIDYFSMEYRANQKKAPFKPLKKVINASYWSLGRGEELERLTLGQVYDFRVRSHASKPNPTMSLPSNIISHKIPGLPLQTAMLAGIVGGVIFALFCLLLGCCVIIRRNKSSGKSPDRSYTNGHQTLYHPPQEKYPDGNMFPTKGSDRAGAANDARGERIPSIARSCWEKVLRFTRRPRFDLDEGPVHSYLKAASPDDFPAKPPRPIIKATSQSPQNYGFYPSDFCHNYDHSTASDMDSGNPSEFKSQQSLDPLVLSDPNATLESVGGLLRHFQSESWQRNQPGTGSMINRERRAASQPHYPETHQGGHHKQVSFAKDAVSISDSDPDEITLDEAPPEGGVVEFRPMGKAGYLFRTLAPPHSDHIDATKEVDSPSAGDYNRDRLLGTIQQLRQSATKLHSKTHGPAQQPPKKPNRKFQRSSASPGSRAAQSATDSKGYLSTCVKGDSGPPPGSSRSSSSQHSHTSSVGTARERIISSASSSGVGTNQNLSPRSPEPRQYDSSGTVPGYQGFRPDDNLDPRGYGNNESFNANSPSNSSSSGVSSDENQTHLLGKADAERFSNPVTAMFQEKYIYEPGRWNQQSSPSVEVERRFQRLREELREARKQAPPPSPAILASVVESEVL